MKTLRRRACVQCSEEIIDPNPPAGSCVIDIRAYLSNVPVSISGSPIIVDSSESIEIFIVPTRNSYGISKLQYYVYYYGSGAVVGSMTASVNDEWSWISSYDDISGVYYAPLPTYITSNIIANNK